MKARRVSTLVLAALLSVAMLVACSPTTAPATTPPAATEQAEATPTPIPDEELYYGNYDPPITLTQPMQADDGKTYPPGDDVNNNVFTRWCEKAMGIKWEAKWTFTTEDEAKQKLALATTSGDLPDLMRLGAGDVATLAKGKMLRPLGDLMDTYCSPLTKYMMDEINQSLSGQYFTAMTTNGQIYAVPYYQDNVCPSFMWYRSDLLQQMGVGAPKTIDDLTAVLAKYKEINPNGVGLILSKELTYSFNAVSFAFGAYPKKWIKVNDQLAYGSIQPQMKEALALLRDYYAKGYIDREFVTKDFWKAMETWNAGNAMSVDCDWWLSWGANKDLETNVPSAAVCGGEYLQGPHGDNSAMINVYNQDGYAITTKCQYPEAILKLYNLYLESAYRNHKDLQDQFKFHFPLEGMQQPLNKEEVEQATKDGKVAFYKYNYEFEGPRNGSEADYFNTQFNWARQYGILLNQRAYQLRNQFLTIAQAYKDGKLDSLSSNDKIAYDTMFFGIDQLRVSHFDNMERAKSLEEQGRVKFNEFMGAPTPSMTSKGAYLDKIELETFCNIIMGEEPLDAFDTFVEQWNSNGGTEITAEVNDWYNGLK